MLELNNLLELAINSAIKAGQEILTIYETPFQIELKSDNTPVTNADKQASKIIIQELAPSSINVLSEEDEHFDYQTRKDWKDIWIIDPLDGTKEFVKRNGEFTVNIALVTNNKPVIGVIYSPTSRNLYFAAQGIGSFKLDGHVVLEQLDNIGLPHAKTLIEKAVRLPLKPHPKVYTVVASRSHLSKEVSKRLEDLRLQKGPVDIINTGSSIKFCLIAEGSAHEYPRFGNTMEWDTAAGQCIVEQSGGSVVSANTGLPILYNRDNLVNEDFIASYMR